MAGKGDKPRKVDQKKFAENFERIFGNGKLLNAKVQKGQDDKLQGFTSLEGETK